MSEKPQKPPKLALFPVYLYEEGLDLDELEGTYYLVTSKGIYMHKETKAGNALVPVDGIPWLEAPSMEFQLKLPKIPGRIIAQALNFFRKVFNKCKSEAYVTLMYNSKTNQYKLHCPKQKVSSGSVNYDRAEVLAEQNKEWQMCGTIHSHCDFSAFHSGTDTGDEATFDGIHITLGHVNRAQFSMVSSIAINAQRETLEPENCCNGVVRTTDKAVRKTQYMAFGDAAYFDIELTEEETQALVLDLEMIEKDWMPKVEYAGYGNYYSGGNYSGKKKDEESKSGNGGYGLGWFSGGGYSEHHDWID